MIIAKAAGKKMKLQNVMPVHNLLSRTRALIASSKVKAYLD